MNISQEITEAQPLTASREWFCSSPEKDNAHVDDQDEKENQPILKNTIVSTRDTIEQSCSFFMEGLTQDLDIVPGCSKPTVNPLLSKKQKQILDSMKTKKQRLLEGSNRVKRITSVPRKRTKSKKQEERGGEEEEEEEETMPTTKDKKTIVLGPTPIQEKLKANMMDPKKQKAKMKLQKARKTKSELEGKRNMLPRAAFKRVLYQMIDEQHCEGMRFSREAVDALMQVSTDYLHQMFVKGARVASHCDRQTLYPTDLQLVTSLKD